MAVPVSKTSKRNKRIKLIKYKMIQPFSFSKVSRYSFYNKILNHDELLYKRKYRLPIK